MTNPRFGNLANILSKTPVDHPVDPTVDDRPADDLEPEVRSSSITRLDQPRSTRVRDDQTATARSRKSSVNASAAASGGVRRVAFRLAPQLYEALVARAAASKTSHGQVVLDAVEDAVVAGTLADLVGSAGGRQEAGGLFPRLQNRAPAEASIPVEIRLDARAVDILDQLTAQVAAGSRTHLITAALTSHLSVN